jgi:hypothetical protein
MATASLGGANSNSVQFTANAYLVSDSVGPAQPSGDLEHSRFVGLADGRQECARRIAKY